MTKAGFMILWVITEKGERRGARRINGERKPEAGKETPLTARERFLTIAQGCHSQGSQNGQREQALHGVSVSCEFACVLHSSRGERLLHC